MGESALDSYLQLHVAVNLATVSLKLALRLDEEYSNEEDCLACTGFAAGAAISFPGFPQLNSKPRKIRRA